MNKEKRYVARISIMSQQFPKLTTQMDNPSPDAQRNIACPVCGQEEADILAPGDSQIYECDECGERFIAEYTDDGILYDGFIGA